ncbi:MULTISPECIES: hypothetical protein [Flavobacterium]|uniref:hypothetical protein n=1 Tax=Flavobacterium TaxID=237 RepID=UPI001FCB85B8|nr:MULTISPECIES: hypothetical protein [Flavobacterium]UOK43562.1 hypothetical protein LZF87_05425 [Flavobacterium enshiense]
MKVLYKKAPIVSIFLSMPLLLQCCSTYDKVPISLDNAVVANTKVKVTTASNKKYKFRKIQRTDGVYYGLAEVRDQIVRVPIEKDEIRNIRAASIPASADSSSGTANIAIMVLYVIGLTAPGH